MILFMPGMLSVPGLRPSWRIVPLQSFGGNGDAGARASCPGPSGGGPEIVVTHIGGRLREGGAKMFGLGVRRDRGL